ncbi:MAG: hypothetical protein ABTQ27_10550, partial [Amaricoccus sp.]
APAFSGEALSFAVSGAGAVIDPATGVTRLPTDAARTAETVTVTASNSGGAAAVGFRVTVKGIAPTLSGVALPDKLRLLRGGAAETQATAQAFAGAVMRYSVATTGPTMGSGAASGVSIDAATGALTFVKTATLAEQTVTVTAANEHGSVSTSFRLSVAMKGIDLADVTLSIRADATDQSTTTVPAGFGTWHIDLREANYPEAITAVWWRGDAHVAGSGPGTGYHPMIRHPSVANRWIARAVTPTTGAPQIRPFIWANDPTPGSTANVLGQSKTHHFIYTTDAAGNPLTGMEFSGPSAALIQRLEMVEERPSDEPLARLMPVVEAAEFGVTDYVPGEGYQLPQVFRNSPANPDILYCGGDSHPIWRSPDFGRSWRRPTQFGLKSQNCMGLAVDPLNANHVLASMGNNFTPNDGGLFRTLDGFETADEVTAGGSALPYTQLDDGATRSSHGDLMAACFSGALGGRSQNILAFICSDKNTAALTVRSTDGGATWTRLTSNNWTSAVGKCRVAVPAGAGNSGRFWVSSSAGLIRIDNAWGTPTYTNARSGNVKAPAYVSADGATVICGVDGVGIFRSTNGLATTPTFTQIGAFTAFDALYISPADPNFMLAIIDDGTFPNTAKVSTNGTTSATFTRQPVSQYQVRPGSIGRTAGGYGSNNSNPNICNATQTACLFDKNDANKVVLTGKMGTGPTANNFYRTVNKGATWQLANAGYSGKHQKSLGCPQGNFDINDKSRMLLNVYDSGAWLTENGCQSFEPFPVDILKEKRNAAAWWPTSLNAQNLVSCGGALHPNGEVIIAAMGGYNSSFGLLRRARVGGVNTWTSISTSQYIKTGVFCYNYAAPGTIMWGRIRSVDGAWATWSVMSGLTAEDMVAGMTCKRSGINHFFAVSRFSSSTTQLVVKRSGDNGASWNTALTLSYKPTAANGMVPFCADPFDGNVIYVRDTTTYRLRRYDLSAGTYTTLNLFGAAGATPPSATYPRVPSISNIQVDPRYANVIWVACDGRAQNGLFVSVDSGATWQEMGHRRGYGTAIASLSIHPLTGECFTSSDQGCFIIPPPYAQGSRLFDGLPYDSYVGRPA